MDFEADSKINVTEESLKELSKLATHQLYIETEIEEKERELTNLKKVHKSISEGSIPAAMQKIGMSQFVLTNGAEIVVKPYYAGKIDDENRVGAFTWLKNQGHSSLIKKEVSLDFGKQENINYAHIQMVMKNEGLEFDMSINEGVHHGTLNAFIKEQVEGGKEFPLDLFKAYVGNKAKISIK